MLLCKEGTNVHMKFIQSLCVTISKNIMLGFVQTGNSEQIVYKSGNFSKLLVLGS